MKLIWAIAGNFLREVIRGRGFPFFVAALVLCALSVHRIGGDLDLLSSLRLGVQYGLGLPVVLIGIATLVVSTGSLGREIESRQLQLVLTRPVPRLSLILGKLLGVLILDGVLILLVGIVVVVSLLVGASSSSAQEKAEADARFFTTRRGVPVVEFDERALSPGESIDLLFSGVRALDAPRASYFLRFRLDGIPRVGTPIVKTRWAFLDREIESRSSAGRWEEIELPASARDNAGRLPIRLRNDHEPESSVRLIVTPARFELLEPHGSFASTFALGLVLVFLQLAFLAALGLFGAAIFSVPTAALVCGFVYLTGLAAPYLHESIDALVFTSGSAQHVEHSQDDGHVHEDESVERLAAALKGVLALLPDFTRDDPVRHLVDGRVFRAEDVLWRYCGAWLSRALLLIVGASFFLGRRELGDAR